MSELLTKAGIHPPIITVARAGDGQPTSMTLDNPSFANLVLAIIAGIVIVAATWKWLRR